MDEIASEQLDRVVGGDARFKASLNKWDTATQIVKFGVGFAASLATAYWFDWRKRHGHD